MKNIGFIGAGNMAEAIIGGIFAQGEMQRADLCFYDPSPERETYIAKTYQIAPKGSIHDLLCCCEVVVLAVKPNIAPQVLAEMDVDDRAVFSIVTGLSYAAMKEKIAAKNCRFLRIMPNTPLMAGEGATVFAVPHTLNDEEFALAQVIFAASGIVRQTDEAHLPAVTGISGSGPAYGYMFIEALADAGVKNGLPRTLAVELAAQTLLGSAKMVQTSGLHTGTLKDNVCSPGGTTIEAVAVLEERSFRGAIIEAVDACVEKAKKM